MEIEKLSWSNTIDEQEKAVSELANSRDIDLKELIMPFGKKDCWANCAKVICARSDKEIIEVALEMFEWLQDLNWPGAMDIVSRLKKLPTDVLREPLINHRYFITIDKSVRESSLSRAFSGFGFPVIRS